MKLVLFRIFVNLVLLGILFQFSGGHPISNSFDSNVNETLKEIRESLESSKKFANEVNNVLEAYKKVDKPLYSDYVKNNSLIVQIKVLKVLQF